MTCGKGAGRGGVGLVTRRIKKCSGVVHVTSHGSDDKRIVRQSHGNDVYHLHRYMKRTMHVCRLCEMLSILTFVREMLIITECRTIVGPAAAAVWRAERLRREQIRRRRASIIIVKNQKQKDGANVV